MSQKWREDTEKKKKKKRRKRKRNITKLTRIPNGNKRANEIEFQPFCSRSLNLTFSYLLNYCLFFFYPLVRSIHSQLLVDVRLEFGA